MIVETAADATEIVKSFVEKMSPGLGFLLRSAVLMPYDDGKMWRVEATVGFQPMHFLVERETGKIRQYGTLEPASRRASKM